MGSIPEKGSVQESLPGDMRPENTCFFTGHRFLSEEQKRSMYPSLVRCILRMAEEGYRYFCNGGAIGFDLFSARTVALLRQDFDRDVRLVMALPCRDQTSRWLYGKDGLDNIRLYRAVKTRAQAVVYMQDFYTDGCMRARNLYMVEHSSRCIAFWNGSIQGGTAQTVRLARKAGLPVYNVYPAIHEGGTVEILSD
ncbi:MAG: DUF1273 family protein [Clostridia bacterium]|nr:DUF1273 family protein [Clostridia bacterium]